MTEAERAQAFLLASGPPLAAVADAQGPVDPFDWGGFEVARGDRFAGLVLHIVGQQISTAVALVLFGRLRAALGGTIAAEPLARASVEELRAAGMSQAKARALTELGRRTVDGEVDLDGLSDLDDAAALAALVSLRGIGPWSAQMFLLHELRRPDVFPAGDLGLRDGLARLDGVEAYAVDEAARRAQVWSPYRSYAAAQVWRWRASSSSSRNLASSPPA